MRRFVLASIPRRVLAGVIDVSITLTPTYIIYAAIMHGSHCAFFLTFFAITCCYHMYFFTSSLHTSVGQRVTKTRVTTCTGETVGMGLAFNRVIVQFMCPTISLLLMQSINVIEDSALALSAVLILQIVCSCFWAYCYMVAVFSKNRQTLYDILCGTVVVMDIP